MKTQQKVMIFIARPKDGGYEWFSRHNAPHPEHGGARWYIVTGSVDDGENEEEAAIREVAEETGITDVQKVVKLPIVSKYQSKFHPDVEFVEQAYLMVTNYNGPIVLNEESDDSQWLSLNDFCKTIWWTQDREELRQVLSHSVSSQT